MNGIWRNWVERVRRAPAPIRDARMHHGRTFALRRLRPRPSKRQALFTVITRRCTARSSMVRRTSSVASAKPYASPTMPPLMQ